MMLTYCCGNFKLKYVESDADILLPVILNYKESGLSSQSKVVPILPDTGVAFVVKRADMKNLPIKILSSIFSSWPVLVLTLLLSVLAGIVAWILVNKLFSMLLKLYFEAYFNNVSCSWSEHYVPRRQKYLYRYLVFHLKGIYHGWRILKNWPIFSSLSFAIRLNLLHPRPSLFLFGLLSPLCFCFSTLANYYFEAFFNLKVILHFAKMA